jgi:succinate dehydrogenase/fumarate reductase flavoprotein subunit
VSRFGESRSFNGDRDIMGAMRKCADASPSISILTGAKVTRLITEARAAACPHVTGVAVTLPSGDRVDLRGDAVLLATGGYAQSAALIAKHRPDLVGRCVFCVSREALARAVSHAFARTVPSTNGTFASGDGIAMAEDAGALAAQLDQVQVQCVAPELVHHRHSLTLLTHARTPPVRRRSLTSRRPLRP